jgi:lipoate-protein ligase A
MRQAPLPVARPDGHPLATAPPLTLWCDGAHDVLENMRRDEALLAAAEAGAPPVLRLFRFLPPGITLGRNQEPSRELDLERCAAAGVAWSVRPTGGRAIFHDQEWTYSLAAPRDHPDWGGGMAAAYARTSELITRSLVRLGVPAHLAARHGAGSIPDPTAGTGGREHPATPCFASTARHEVVLGTGKLVGSAQRRTAAGLLQQGSVLLGPGHLRLADYLALRPEARARVRDALRLATSTAAPWLGSDPPLERWADALAAELGPRSSRVEAAAGAFLLTPSASGSYTAPVA